jgi:hypothetical protein
LSAIACKLLYIHDPSARFDVLVGMHTNP